MTLRNGVDWSENEQVLLGGAVCVACSLIEKAIGKNTEDVYIKMQFKIRNAFVHNNCNIEENWNEGDLEYAQDYLSLDRHLALNDNLNYCYFSLDGSIVQFTDSLFLAIRTCLDGA